MQIYRFPADTSNLGSFYPYTKLQMIKFRERNFVVDDESKAIVTVSEKKELLDTIILPLPEEISNSYSMDWEMSNMQSLGFLESLVNNNSLVGSFTSGNAGADLTAILAPGIAKVFKQRTPNPKKQALFNGINPRTFNLSYTLVPHSLQEAKAIEKIVKILIENSLPELTETESFYKFPAEFLISYKNVEGMPKISPCVCTQIETNYTSNTIQLFHSGHSVQTRISLSFMETELLRKQKPGI